jgi:phosphate-selective porin OprO/OprP
MKKITFLFLVASLFGHSQTNGVQLFSKRNNGFELVAKDSLFSCQFQFRMQNRMGYESTSTEDFTPETFEFRVRRLRLNFRGFMYNPKWTYRIQLSFARADMDWESTKSSSVNTSVNVVRDATIAYNFTKDFNIMVGQTKLPGNRQRVVSSGDLQFVDRSLVNSTLTLDRDFGLFLNYEKNYFKLKGAITSGEGRNSSKSDKGLSYTGRIEFLPFGKFTGKNDYVEGDLEREQKPKVSIAVTGNYNMNAMRVGGTLGDDLYTPTTMKNLQVDALFKYKGFAWYNEYCIRTSENPITYNADTSKFATVFNGFGYLSQVSYLFKNNWEIAARYAMINPFSSIYQNSTFTSVNVNRQDQLHAGVTKYIAGHRLKVQLNLTYNTKTNLRTDDLSGKIGAFFQIEAGI